MPIVEMITQDIKTHSEWKELESQVAEYILKIYCIYCICRLNKYNSSIRLAVVIAHVILKTHELSIYKMNFDTVFCNNSHFVSFSGSINTSVYSIYAQILNLGKGVFSSVLINMHHIQLQLLTMHLVLFIYPYTAYSTHELNKLQSI